VERNTVGTLSLAAVQMKLRQIAEKAKQEPELQFTALAHLLTVEVLELAYNGLRKKASPGIDGVTWETYGQNLRENLEDLHRRLREKRYRAQPVRRVYIEKENGKKRPLGIPCLVDKIVQAAVVDLLEPIYEADFLDYSYGSRPNRNSHQALDAIYKAITHGKVSFVLDADITSYFDNIVKSNLMEFMERRIKDPSILRLINKWLNSGVIDNGELLVSEHGTPQGAVISPLLANIYLHYVLDEWVEKEIRPRFTGEIHLIRYVDDFVVGFQYQGDAEHFLSLLEKRFAHYGLELSKEKTHLIPFGRFAVEQEARKGRTPSTFPFLGFTHICGKNEKTGKFALHLRTISKRLHRSVKAVFQWCKANRHKRLRDQCHDLSLKLMGHYGYYGRRTNMPSLRQYFYLVKRTWGYWLRKRSQRRPLSWKRFYYGVLKRHPLPEPRIVQQGFRETRQLVLRLT
jgi:RNA-directed DNA polymerase